MFCNFEIFLQVLGMSIVSRLHEYFYSWYRSILCKTLKCGPVPQHVAFIMDGNRRFAKKNNEQTLFGHQMGEKRLQDVRLAGTAC